MPEVIVNKVGDVKIFGKGLLGGKGFGLVKIKTGFERRLAAPHPAAKEPAFATPYVPKAIEPGNCREGWVSVVASGEETVLEGANAILFDPSAAGFVPPGQQVKIAWLIR